MLSYRQSNEHMCVSKAPNAVYGISHTEDAGAYLIDKGKKKLLGLGTRVVSFLEIEKKTPHR